MKVHTGHVVKNLVLYGVVLIGLGCQQLVYGCLVGEVRGESSYDSLLHYFK